MFVVQNPQSSFWEICLQQSEPHELIIKQSKGNQEAGVSLGLCRGERLCGHHCAPRRRGMNGSPVAILLTGGLDSLTGPSRPAGRSES